MMPSATEMQEKRLPKRHRRFRVRPAYVVLILLMGLFAFKFVQKTQQIKTLTAQEVALRQQNLSLEANRDSTRRAILRYRSPQYVEDTARSVLGFTKPGETLIQIQPSPPVVEHFRAAPSPSPRAVQASWKQWWSSFFG